MSQNPYAPPGTEVADPMPQGTSYAGFWARTGAALIDAVILIAITYPILLWIYGTAYFDPDKTGFVAGPADLLLTWVFPAVAALFFWMRKQATPGKLALSMRIVDAKSGGPLSMRQSIVRYLGYFVAGLPLGLGILWVAFDARKQGWHDKIAGTLVVRPGKN